MKLKTVTLVFNTSNDFFESESGQIYLCKEELRKYFDIPNVSKITIVVYSTPGPNRVCVSWKCRHHVFFNIDGCMEYIVSPTREYIMQNLPKKFYVEVKY